MTALQNGWGRPGHRASGYASSPTTLGYPEEKALRDEPDGETSLLTAAQLAERWQVPVRTIYAWAKRNEIPHYRVGRLLRFDSDEVQDHCRRARFAQEIIPDDEHPGESGFALLTA